MYMYMYIYIYIALYETLRNFPEKVCTGNPRLFSVCARDHELWHTYHISIRISTYPYHAGIVIHI